MIVPGGGAAAAAPARPAQPQPWPSSAEATRLEERAAARAKKAGLLLLRSHVARQVGAGWRGAAAAAALVYVAARVCLAAVVRTLARACGACLTAALPDSVGVRAAAASAAVASWASRELAALGHSAGEVAGRWSSRGSSCAQRARRRTESQASREAGQSCARTQFVRGRSRLQYQGDE